MLFIMSPDCRASAGGRGDQTQAAELGLGLSLSPSPRAPAIDRPPPGSAGWMWENRRGGEVCTPIWAAWLDSSFKQKRRPVSALGTSIVFIVWTPGSCDSSLWAAVPPAVCLCAPVPAVFRSPRLLGRAGSRPASRGPCSSHSWCPQPWPGHVSKPPLQSTECGREAGCSLRVEEKMVQTREAGPREPGPQRRGCCRVQASMFLWAPSAAQGARPCRPFGLRPRHRPCPAPGLAPVGSHVLVPSSSRRTGARGSHLTETHARRSVDTSQRLAIRGLVAFRLLSEAILPQGSPSSEQVRGQDAAGRRLGPCGRRDGGVGPD